jgi:hypothetical protein
MRKRDAVAVLQRGYRIGTRRACRLVGHHRITQNYRSRSKRERDGAASADEA